MSKGKRTTPCVATQPANPTRSLSGLDWNIPRKPRTPRREFAFMRAYSLVWSQSPNGGSFGPFNGGVAQ